MRVMIAGHAGYIGPVAARLFADAGHEVIGLDIGYFSECAAPDAPPLPLAREIRCDLREVTPAHLEGVDAVVHLAALSNDPLGKINPRLTHEINFEGGLKLARAARDAGVSRFVFASSCSIYGAAGDAGALDESAPFNPVSAYALSKVQMEAALQALADTRFSPVYLRNATAFGVSPRMRLDLVLNNLVAWARTTGVVKVLSDGTPWRPIVHIEDISRAALAAVEAPREAVHDQAFNIGRADCNYQVREIAQAVAEAVPEARVEITGESGGDPRSYRVSFDKALTRLPGFAPVWDLKAGVRELVAWIDGAAAPRDSEDAESRRFIRLKQLRHLMDAGVVDGSLRLIA